MTNQIGFKNNLRSAGLLLMVIVSLAGCGGGGGGGGASAPPAAAPGVPTSAYSSTDSFIAFLRDLAADDTAEPLDVGETQPPTDDTADAAPTPMG